MSSQALSIPKSSTPGGTGPGITVLQLVVGKGVKLTRTAWKIRNRVEEPNQFGKVEWVA